MPIILENGVEREITETELQEIVGSDNSDGVKFCRSVRNNLLAETDWWANSDRTMTQAEIDYRQALRDITSQAGFPDNVTWPTKP